MFRNLTGILLILMVPMISRAQNKYIPPDPYTNWDGITHKSKYLITSPGYMGPNSLPVPALHKGRVPENFYWTGRYEYYLGNGNQTQDFYTRFIIPLKNRVGIEFTYVPVEFYSMDSATSRSWRTFSGTPVEGHSLGDIYFGTIIQVIRDNAYLPDLSFAMTCRTASGTGRENARHTDTPGYHLDISMGDSYGAGEGIFRSVGWYLEGGFLVWQTYLDNYPQNDAWLYGLGLDLEFRDFYLHQSLRGYSGYMNNGDKPLVYSTELGVRIGTAAFTFGYEYGIRDYPFQCFRTGICLDGLK
jgi:hypothetical protein